MLGKPGLRIAVPSKGRLMDSSVDLLQKSGLRFRVSGRRLFSECSDSDTRIIFSNAADIPVLVERGVVDLGITGSDQVEEKKADVTVHHQLGFGRCRLSVAVHRDSTYTSPADLNGKTIGAKFVSLAQRFLDENGVEGATIIPIQGAVEVMVLLGMVDAIVEIVETGNSLVENDLVEVETLLHAEAVLIGNRQPSDPAAAEVALRRVEGILHAARYSLVEYNCPVISIDEATQITPGFSSPTIQELADPDWVAVKVLVPKQDVPLVMDRLEHIGCAAIFETSIRNTRL